MLFFYHLSEIGVIFTMEKKPDLKAMPPKKKVEYIWDYYRWHIIITIAVVAAVISLIHHYVTYVDPLLNVIMINSYADMNYDIHDGFQEFFDQQGCELDVEDAVSISSNLYFTEEDTEGTNYQYMQVLMAMIAAGDQDLFFGTGDIYLSYAEEGVLMDLSTLLSEETLEKYEDCLIYSTDNGESDSYPCAIELTDNEWVKNNGYYGGCYFGVFVNNANQERAVDFAEYLLNY